jgi:hypothetical protein
LRNPLTAEQDWEGNGRARSWLNFVIKVSRANFLSDF